MVANEMAYKQLVARFRPIKLPNESRRGMIANSAQVTHWLYSNETQLQIQ